MDTFTHQDKIWTRRNLSTAGHRTLHAVVRYLAPVATTTQLPPSHYSAAATHTAECFPSLLSSSSVVRRGGQQGRGCSNSVYVVFGVGVISERWVITCPALGFRTMWCQPCFALPAVCSENHSFSSYANLSGAGRLTCSFSYQDL